MRTISRENEIKKAEGQSVINAVKVFDKSYPLEVHCNTLEKMIFPYLDTSKSKPNTLKRCDTVTQQHTEPYLFYHSYLCGP